MKITYYNSARFDKTTTETAWVILGALDPDEITDVDRDAMRSGEMETLCNFARPDGTWMAVPWHWVIEIDE